MSIALWGRSQKPRPDGDDGRPGHYGRRVDRPPPDDLFGEDLTWVQPRRRRRDAVGPEPRPRTPDRPAPRRRPARRRPTRRTFLIRRLVACAVLGGVVLGVVALAAGGGKGRLEEPSPGLPKAGPAAVPPAAAAPGSLAALVPQQTLLEMGDRGREVRRVQQALAVVGFAPGVADGLFQDGTRTAVAAFQQAHGLPAQGIVEASTARALTNELLQWGAAQAQAPTAGLATAVGAGRLSPRSAARYRSILSRALAGLVLLPPDRATLLGAVLRDVGAHAAVYDERRALALFTMLEANTRWLATRPLPKAGADSYGRDGVVYRFFPDHGYQFHPLANFAHLNGLVAVRGRDRAAALVTALRARAIPSDGGLVWEYYFPFGSAARWTSALAQSVGAQALARAARLLRNTTLSRVARSAYLPVPRRLARRLGGGIWVREYSFSDIAILNAQLQSLVSLSDYARLTGDAEARAFAGRLGAATRALLPRLDTGCWSLYSIGGSAASVHYHRYHVALLEQLGARRSDPLWARTAARWQRYADSGRCTT